MQTVQTVTLEDVTALVVPPTSGGYLRLISGDIERFFQPLGSRWGGLPGQPDGVDSFIIVNPADSFFSPCAWARPVTPRSEEHTSELQSPCNLVCRLLLEKKKKIRTIWPERKWREPPTQR